MSNLTGEPIRIGILAGESSGDILGAGLMQSLKLRYPAVQFEGIGGSLMEAQGLQSRFPMERLSVMGLVEPLRRLPELLRIRRDIVQHFLQQPPALFIGIDSPDFNLGVELELKARGIRTVHYVSPSVWAWREKRINKIARAVDHVLALFPFEKAIYVKHNVPVTCVGHPLADVIPLQPDRQSARRQLALNHAGTLLALLPGSRLGEVSRLATPFLRAALLLCSARTELHCVLPCATAACRKLVEQLPEVKQLGQRLTLTDGESRLVMQAADAALVASGTATLEALLFKLPMLVCYRMAPLSYALISRMLKVKWFSLPNLLADESLVEELVQDQVQPAVLAARMAVLLDSGNSSRTIDRYLDIHRQLRLDANERAADAVARLL